MSKIMLNRLISLWDNLAESAQSDGCATSEDRRSFRTRARAEGLPYLSDGLARLGRWFLEGVRVGRLDGTTLTASGWELKDGSTLPLFLYSAFSRVFADTGYALGGSFETTADGHEVLTSWTPPIDAMVAVSWLRQLTVVYSKLRTPHNVETRTAVLARFIANEDKLKSLKGALWGSQLANNVRIAHSSGSTQRVTDVLLNARRLMHRILCNVDPRDIIPRHGSGASACRTRPWERYDRILFHPDLDRIWPWIEFAASGVEHRSQLVSAGYVQSYSRTARGVFVPKDYRGERLISCEPATSMYHQQGLMNLIVPHLERHPYTSGYVNFTDQRINQRLAREGSVDRKTATLDLKDASDLLSWDLIALLWPKHWFDALCAVRSRVTEIVHPTKGPIKVPLRKHAPMGSATCFPVMALTIWTLIKAASISHRSRVWIYGDDIIVASKDADHICTLLETVGLSVNRDKSFTGATPFRESCGKEYWDGFDVTPVYCRYDPSNNDTTIGTLCAFANNIAQHRGYTKMHMITDAVHRMTKAPIVGRWDDVGDDADSLSDKRILGDLAYVFGPNEDDVMGDKPIPHVLYGAMYQCMRSTMRQRTNRDLQVTEYRIRRPYPVDVNISPESWGYVLRSSLIGGDLGFANRAALTKRVQYKYDWAVIPHSRCTRSEQGGNL